jgi:acyl carrier protein
VSVTHAEVRAFVLEQLESPLREAGIDAATLTDDTDLFAEGVVDSLGVVELIAVVSDRFEIGDEWDDYDPDDLLVIGAFCNYVAQRSEANEGGVS